MLFVFQWKENASQKHGITIQWESFRGGKVYQYPLQCKRQRVKAQREGGIPYLPLTGMCRLTGSDFLTGSLKKSMLVWKPSPPARRRVGGGGGRGEGDSRALIHVRNSASMWRSWHHVTTYIPYKTCLLETEHYKCPMSGKSETLDQTWCYWGVSTERNPDN